MNQNEIDHIIIEQSAKSFNNRKINELSDSQKSIVADLNYLIADGTFNSEYKKYIINTFIK
jgi:hypothetical protein